MICSFIFLISQLQRNLFPKTLQVPDIQAIISYPLCLKLVVGDYFVGYNDDSISGEKEFSSNDFYEAVRLFFRGNSTKSTIFPVQQNFLAGLLCDAGNTPCIRIFSNFNSVSMPKSNSDTFFPHFGWYV